MAAGEKKKRKEKKGSPDCRSTPSRSACRCSAGTAAAHKYSLVLLLDVSAVHGAVSPEHSGPFSLRLRANRSCSTPLDFSQLQYSQMAADTFVPAHQNICLAGVPLFMMSPRIVLDGNVFLRSRRLLLLRMLCRVVAMVTALNLSTRTPDRQILSCASRRRSVNRRPTSLIYQLFV